MCHVRTKRTCICGDIFLSRENIFARICWLYTIQILGTAQREVSRKNSERNRKRGWDTFLPSPSPQSFPLIHRLRFVFNFLQPSSLWKPGTGYSMTSYIFKHLQCKIELRSARTVFWERPFELPTLELILIICRAIEWNISLLHINDVVFFLFVCLFLFFFFCIRELHLRSYY